MIYFKTENSINRQVGYYLSARVLEGFWLKLSKDGYLPQSEMFQMTYTIIWGVVMYLYELDKKILNGSLVSSMEFLYKNSDTPLGSYKELIPFDVPG